MGGGGERDEESTDFVGVVAMFCARMCFARGRFFILFFFSS